MKSDPRLARARRKRWYINNLSKSPRKKGLRLWMNEAIATMNLSLPGAANQHVAAEGN